MQYLLQVQAISLSGPLLRSLCWFDFYACTLQQQQCLIKDVAAWGSPKHKKNHSKKIRFCLGIAQIGFDPPPLSAYLGTLCHVFFTGNEKILKTVILTLWRNILTVTMVKNQKMILRWHSDGNHGKYWWNMMKIRFLSITLNGLCSLKNCHKPFGFRPSRPFGQCPRRQEFSYRGAPLARKVFRAPIIFNWLALDLLHHLDLTTRVTCHISNWLRIKLWTSAWILITYYI